MSSLGSVVWSIADQLRGPFTRHQLREVRIRQKTNLGFYNKTSWTFPRLLGDPEGLQANLIDYISGFSKSIDVFNWRSVR